MRSKLLISLAVIVILSLLYYGVYKGVKMAEGSSQTTRQTDTTVQQLDAQIDAGNFLAYSTNSIDDTGVINQTGFYDIPGLEATISISEANTRRIKITVFLNSLSVNPDNEQDRIYIAIREGSEVINAIYFNNNISSATRSWHPAVDEQPYYLAAVLLPSSGSHTYKVSAGTNRSNQFNIFWDSEVDTNTAAPGAKSFILIEYI